MKTRAKAVLAASCALAATTFRSTPADALTQDRAQRNITFPYQGRNVTCTLAGTSTYNLGQLDGRRISGISVTTTFSGTDPACSSAVRTTGASASWYRNGTLIGLVDATSPVGLASTSVASEGVATEVTGVHWVRVDCDSEPDLGCYAEVITSPK